VHVAALQTAAPRATGLKTYHVEVHNGHAIKIGEPGRIKRGELDWRLGLIEDAGRLSRRLGLGGVARRLSRRSGFSRVVGRLEIGIGEPGLVGGLGRRFGF
jgi:hypothetical protein